MKRHIEYLKYLSRHKWYMFQASMKVGVPLWIAIFHDWDKFLPSEWMPYAVTFYNKDGSKRYQEFPEFAAAWNMHQKINKHHWQYWILTWDRGESECIPMPEVYIRELLDDWIGAGKAIAGKDDPTEWYMQNKHKIIIHPTTRDRIEELLKIYFGK